MAKLNRYNGVTSMTLRVKILDSSSTVGAGLAGLTSASSGLIISTIAGNEAAPTVYTVAGSTIETITTLGTYAAPTATKCRFKEVDATNHKGIYEIHLADARFSVANAKSLVVSVFGATNAAPVDAEIDMLASSDLQFWRGTQPNALISGRVEGVLGAVTAGVIAAASFAANALDAVWSTTTRVLSAATNLTTALATPTNITAGTITTVTTLTGHTPQTGDSYARIGAAGVGLTAVSVAVNGINRAAFAADTGLQSIRSNTAQAGGASTITLDASASAVDDFDGYIGSTIFLTGGTGAGQYPTITDYVGATKVATVDNPWSTVPDGTTTFAILPGSASPAQVALAVWAETARTLTAATNITSTGGTTVPQTGDAYARIGAPAGASASADIAAVKVDTAAILVDTSTTLDGRIPAALVSGRMDSSVGAMAANTLTASALATDAVAELADQVWDETLADHLAAGGTGNALNAAGGSGDPWSTAVPGAYGAGTAGKILGDNLNATMSSRATPAQVATELSIYDGPTNTEMVARTLATADYAPATATTAIKAKTDLIPASPAAVSNIPTALENADALLARDIGSGTGAGTLNERTVRASLRFNRNKFTIVAGVLTVYREDDSTVAFTAAITQTAGNPVSASDPT